MAKPPAKKPSAKKPAAPRQSTKGTAPKRPLVWRSKPAVKRTAAERKAKAIELALMAFAGGWTIARFCRHSHISKSALLRWLAEDTVQPRFLRAMQVKALALPDEASEIVRRIITGQIDPKAGGVALRHIEFRMMREIKIQYQPSRLVTNTNTQDLPDDVVDQRFAELMERHLQARQQASEEAEGQENDAAAG